MCESDFHVISRFRNDVVLYYPTLEKKTGKRGHPKWFDGRIDFANLDLTRCKEYEVNKGKLYGLRVYAKALKRYVSLAVWYPMDGRTDKWQLYFSTDDSMDGREVLDYYRTRFQLEFCFRRWQAACRNHQLSVNRLQKVGFSLQCVACCCQLGQSGM